jgi:hypothetical protein
MRSRVVVGAVVGVAAVLGVVVVAWPDDSDRTERVLEVYARQLGLSDSEAHAQREDALEIAEVYCSIEPEELEDFMAGATTPVEDAIAYAEAACPEMAREFKQATERGEIEADLRVFVDTEMPAADGPALFRQLAAVPGVARLEGFEEGVLVVLHRDAEIDEVVATMESLDGVMRVERK